MTHKKKQLLLFLVLVSLLLLILGAGFREATPLKTTIQNFGHVPAFGTIALVVLLILKTGDHPGKKLWQSYLMAFAITTLLGIVTELIQIPMERDADIMDLLLDMAGASAFLSFAAAGEKGWKEKKLYSRLFMLAGIVILIITMIPLISLSISMGYRSHIFPLLSGFESRWVNCIVNAQQAEIKFVQPPPAWSGNSSGRCARVQVMPEKKYPGIHMQELQSDWSEYSFFSFEIFNPQDTVLALTLRIHDRAHDGAYSDRFNHRIRLPRGAHRVCIPLDTIMHAPRRRLMRLEEIAGIIWFSSFSHHAYVYYIDNIMLSNDCDSEPQGHAAAIMPQGGGHRVAEKAKA
ncbi:MAG: VanZ family protein, partial [Chitinispirillaceae bacterium]